MEVRGCKLAKAGGVVDWTGGGAGRMNSGCEAGRGEESELAETAAKMEPMSDKLVVGYEPVLRMRAIDSARSS